ncbi:MAG: hypothetical protein JWO60_608 [Frankiales bacterium]|nr:hypothetical protein [Frankiales bacterium]
MLLTTYALVLLGVAEGLRALGRRSTAPSASRTLAGHLRATGAAVDTSADAEWPHVEVPRLHAVIGLVAVLAAALLSLGSLGLHHDGPLVALALTVLVLSVLSGVRMARSLR